MLRRRDETVAAPATAPGRAALSLVRITGPRAHQAIQILAGRSFEDRRPTLAALAGAGRAMVTLFLGPRSYTGEDLVEIALYGSPVLEEDLLRRLGGAGVRPALPGEFTFRAVLNGKMDLVQAEGVASLIDAKTPLQAERALASAEGALSARLEAIKESLAVTLALVQAAVEFPEEGLDADEARILQALRAMEAETRALAGACLPAERGGALTIAIAGPPNAGKSTLFNRLAGADRALVTPEPGTTRDGLREGIRIKGCEIVLEDSAGIFDAADAVTARAVERAMEGLGAAGRVLWLADASQPRAPQVPEAIAGTLGDRMAVAANKADLGLHPDWAGGDAPVFSALTGEGVDALVALFSDWAAEADREGREAAFFVTWRQEEALASLASHLENAVRILERGGELELAAQETLDGVAVLAELTGEIPVEAVLDRIFSTFCIGK